MKLRLSSEFYVVLKDPTDLNWVRRAKWFEKVNFLLTILLHYIIYMSARNCAVWTIVERAITAQIIIKLMKKMAFSILSVLYKVILMWCWLLACYGSIYFLSSFAFHRTL